MKSGKVDLTSFDNKVSYMIGQDIGRSIKDLDSTINLAILERGIEDFVKSRPSMMNDSQMAAIKQQFSTMMQEKKMTEMKAAGEKNQKAGDDFLAENTKKAGITTTSSGLQYQVTKEGTGASPKATDKVTVNYKGTLIDGKEFDNSFKRGQPATFPVGGVIPGWSEGLQLMKIGGSYKLWIPAKLGYGERGAGSDIPPNATLIFEVDLISIEK